MDVADGQLTFTARDRQARCPRRRPTWAVLAMQHQDQDQNRLLNERRDMDRGSSKHRPELDEQMEREDETIRTNWPAAAYRGVAGARAVRPGAPDQELPADQEPAAPRGMTAADVELRVGHRRSGSRRASCPRAGTRCWSSCGTRAPPTTSLTPSPACPPGARTRRSARSSGPWAFPMRTTRPLAELMAHHSVYLKENPDGPCPVILYGRDAAGAATVLCVLVL